MKHYGNITQINGANIEPVDIITFGSPCQDMSISGKRKGLNGNRSSLFYEAIRIIKEMREATHDKYPQYIVWENVTGAFSSNKGEDFRSVLESICHIKNPTTTIPQPDKWEKSGTIMADNYSLAWRVLDAQYWGVPQRRKRIYLVADFTGQRAGKILFESEGMSQYSPSSFRAWQETTRSIEEGSRTSIGMNMKTYGISSTFSRTILSNNPHSGIYKAKTSPTLDTNGGYPACNQGGIVIVTNKTTEKNTANALIASDYKNPPTVTKEPEYTVRKLTPTECARLQGFPDWWCNNLGENNPTNKEMEFWRNVFETHRNTVTHTTKPKTDNQIRKWLQNPHTDTAEYKMWGNGVALPCVFFILSGITYYNQTKKEKK